MADLPPIDRRRFLEIGTVAALGLPVLASACVEDPLAAPDGDAASLDTELPDADASGLDAFRADADALRADAGPQPDVFTPPDAPEDGAVALVGDPNAWLLDEALFPLGVQAGAPTATGALLWGFATDAPSMRLLVWREGAGATPETDAAAPLMRVFDDTVPAVDGYMHVPVTGLAGGVWYRYVFVDSTGAKAPLRSVIGRFRTALPEGAWAPLTFAATACTNLKRKPFESIATMSKTPVDAFLHLGDMAYCDSASTQAGHRAIWRETLEDPGYRAMLSGTGIYATLDDHEVADNSARYGFSAERYAIGIEAWAEAVPVPRTAEGRIWHSKRWGHTAEIFVLDCRTERVLEPAAGEPRQYISTAQMEWLKAGLRDSPCHFKIIMNSVPITNLPPLWISVGDRWQGFPEQREELLDALVADDVRNIWFLTGDFHCGMITRVERSGPKSRMTEIMVGPGDPYSLNPLPNLHLLYTDPEERQNVRDEILPTDMFLWTSTVPATTTLTFDPHANTVHVRYLSADGADVLYDEVLTEPSV